MGPSCVHNAKPRGVFSPATFAKNVFAHIAANAKSKDIYLEAIGGWSEHLHLLISLGRENSRSLKVAMLIKGESSHWLNEQHFFRGKFAWQDDYFALSVSESLVEKVRRYIKNQEAHHQAVPFADEFDRFSEVAKGKLG